MNQRKKNQRNAKEQIGLKTLNIEYSKEKSKSSEALMSRRSLRPETARNLKGKTENNPYSFPLEDPSKSNSNCFLTPQSIL